MIEFLAVPVIAAANRFRGGWGIVLLPGESKQPDKKNTQQRRILYTIAVGLASLSPFVAATAYLALLTGWGFPVSAAIGRRAKTDFEAEWLPLDAVAGNLTKLIFGEYRSQPYGVIWLTLHGLLFGGLMALFTWNPAFLLLVGMGLCYYLTRDWEYGEVAFGALFGLAISLYWLIK